jgi:tRNA(Ile)-lysidine synthase
MPELNTDALSFSGRHLLAFSGGPDSTCLLSLLHHHGLGTGLRVVHVDHGLDPDSGERARRAVELADALGSFCEVRRIEVTRGPADGGLEAAARRQRYACMSALLQRDEYLLTAHHAEDQAETVLLRLLRGTGPEGLAGMRALRSFPPGWLGRPLLHWTREQIDAVVTRLDIRPLQDPGNLDLARDRNYLRRVILPSIGERWPGYRKAFNRAAGRQRYAARAVRGQAHRDWHSIRRVRPTGEELLDLRGWLALDHEAALEVLRYWCRDLPMPPPTARLEVFRNQVRKAGADSQPRMAWDAACLHAWADSIWLDRDAWTRQAGSVAWTTDDGVAVSAGGRMVTEPAAPRAGEWSLGPLEPGARLRLRAEGPSRKVTDLLREAGIPPWRRPAMPALYIDEALCAVSADWVDHRLAGWLTEHGSRLRWRRRPAALLPCPRHDMRPAS